MGLRGVASLLLLSVAWSAGSTDHVLADSQAPIAFAVVAGTTTIFSGGFTGITLRMPKGLELPTENVSFTLEGGTFAYFRIGENPSNSSCRWPGYDLCLSHIGLITRWFSRDPSPSEDPPVLIGASENPVTPGLHDIYIFTDGLVKLTLRFPSLSGSTQLTATGAVDGEFVALPAECIQPICNQRTHGGMTRHVGHPAIVAAYVYSVAGSFYPDQPVLPPFGYTRAHACIYPGADGPWTSSDPEQHPYGCDVAPNASSPYPWDAIQRWAFPGSTSSSAGVLHEYSFAPLRAGPQYIGYVTQQAGLTYGNRGAYGLWLTAGIACPSGDFTDCGT